MGGEGVVRNPRKKKKRATEKEGPPVEKVANSVKKEKRATDNDQKEIKPVCGVGAWAFKLSELDKGGRKHTREGKRGKKKEGQPLNCKIQIHTLGDNFPKGRWCPWPRFVREEQNKK